MTRYLSLVFLLCALGCETPPPTLAELPVRDLRACNGPPARAASPANVAVIIDASRSTIDPTGVDVDENGVVGEPYMGAVGLKYDTGSTDPADTLLVAQVVAVRSLFHFYAGSDTRFALLTIGGKHPERRESATILVGLTSDLSQLEAGLSQVVARGSVGWTDLAAGIRLAKSALRDPSTQPQPSVHNRSLLVSDSPKSTVENTGIANPPIEPAIAGARRAGIAFDTFGLSEAAATTPPHDLSRIATETGGTYHPVSDILLLGCELVSVLSE